jgi:hypothetical protein
LQPADKRDPFIHFLVKREPELLFARNYDKQIPREFAKSRRIKKMLLAFEEEQEKKAAAAADESDRSRAGDHSYTVSSKNKNGKDIGDLTVLGPLDEPEQNKRRRLLAMIEKLPIALAEAAAAADGVNKGLESSDAAARGGENSMSAAASAAFGAIVTAAADATLPDVEVAAVEVYDSDDDYEDSAEEDPEDPLSAAAAAGVVAGGFTDLGAALQGLPWELIVTREAYLEWGGMDPNYRQMVLLKLREIGQGRWESMGACKRRMRDVPPELNLWRCKFTRAGRIVFDIAQDFSASKGIYTDMIRIWCITLSHDRCKFKDKYLVLNIFLVFVFSLFSNFLQT